MKNNFWTKISKNGHCDTEQKSLIKFVFKYLAQAARYKNSNLIFIKAQSCIYLNSNVQSEIQLLLGI